MLLAGKPDFRTKPFIDLKKSDIVFAFNPLYDNQVPAWISERCRILGKDVDLEACRLLHAYVGNSLRAIQNELDKLFTYLGERTRVTPEDVADVVGVTRGFTVFDLQNAIGKKNLEEALRIDAGPSEPGRKEDDKRELEENVVSNVKDLIIPYVDRLKKMSLEKDQMTIVGILETNLNNVVSPFIRKVSSKMLKLTPMEIRIANLIKEGKTSKDIAELLFLSENTILSHRYNMRTKLGVKKKKINIISYLRSFEE